MNKRMWMIGVGLFLAAVALRILWRANAPTEPGVTADSKVTVLNSAPPTPPPSPSGASSKATQTLVQWNQLEQNAQLIRMPLPEANGETVVPLTLSIVNVCHPGDANALELELKARPTHKAMLTLENLSTKKVYRQDLAAGFWRTPETPIEFRIPPVTAPTQFGLYLCTAEASDEECGSKPFPDLNQIFAEHSRRDPKAGQESRTLFFQYVLVDERGAATFGRVAGAQNFTNLKAYAQARKIAEEPIERAEKLTLALKGYPLEIQGQRLKIPLPKYDVSACGRQRPPTEKAKSRGK